MSWTFLQRGAGGLLQTNSNTSLASQVAATSLRGCVSPDAARAAARAPPTRPRPSRPEPPIPPPPPRRVARSRSLRGAPRPCRSASWRCTATAHGRPSHASRSRPAHGSRRAAGRTAPSSSAVTRAPRSSRHASPPPRARARRFASRGSSGTGAPSIAVPSLGSRTTCSLARRSPRRRHRAAATALPPRRH